MSDLKSARGARDEAATRILVQGPSDFDGTLARLFTDFIEPNLPTRESVSRFHETLMQYVASANPLFLLRMVTGTERRKEYVTADGTRFKPTDNAPAWWTQYAVFQGHTIAHADAERVVATIPAHMFDVPKSLPTSAAKAGWHIAHIFPVKDGKTAYREWTRKDVTARFMRNVHPCNYFLFPKQDWMRWGGDPRVIAFFAELHAQRYGDVWREFLELSGGTMPDVAVDASELRITLASDSSQRPDHVAMIEGAGAATYSATRLLFKAAVIEPLLDDESFRVITPDGTFQFTKAEFYAAFPKLVLTASYRVNGIYHFPKIPSAALPFRVS